VCSLAPPFRLCEKFASISSMQKPIALLTSVQ
jgi:hypothetical protein